MKRILVVILIGVLFVSFSCRKKEDAFSTVYNVRFEETPETETGTPQAIIDLIAKSYKKWSPHAEVWEYPFNGRTVYAVSENRGIPPLYSLYDADGTLICETGGDFPVACEGQ